MFSRIPKRGDVVVATREVKEHGLFTSRTVVLPGMVGVVIENPRPFDLTGTVTVRFDGGRVQRMRPDQLDRQNSARPLAMR